jgi:hypothetical protein
MQSRKGKTESRFITPLAFHLSVLCVSALNSCSLCFLCAFAALLEIFLLFVVTLSLFDPISRPQKVVT